MHRILLLLSFFCFSFAHANNVLDDLIKNEQPTFLAVDQAFKLDFDQQGQQLFISFDIAKGYYLYKKRFQFVAKNAQAVEPVLPQGVMIEDETYGHSEVYFDEMTTIIKFDQINANAEYKIRFQGCAEAGLCYPFETISIPLVNYQDKHGFETQNTAITKIESTDSTNSKNDDRDQTLTERLAGQGLVANLAIFFLLGLTLALTPCVFPMFPILSSLIAGQSGELSTKKAFMLSFVYVQGMAITYAALGLVVATLGGQVQGYLQHPYILIAFSLLFVVLAMSMFGLFDIKLPESWMTRLTQVSNKQKNGQYAGVFLMGILSGLIASPCTTAPLSAALLYVAQSGDYFVGGITLYVLSLGMGVPLLLLGTSGGKLLPKAGAWMNQVKTLFGFIMLVVPLILLERILDAEIIITLAALLGISTAAYLYYWHTQTQAAKAKTVLWVSAFILLFFSLTVLKQQIFPAQVIASDKIATQETVSIGQSQFIKIKNLAELESRIEQARAENKLVMLDLYADWCVACKEFEHKTFPAPSVQTEFKNYLLLQADLTESDETTIEFMEKFTIFGLPSILFFNQQGEEISAQRVTGFKNAKEFSTHLQQLSQQELN